MIGRSAHKSRPRRRGGRTFGRPAQTRFRYLIAGATGGILATGLLAACGTSSASTGPVTLNFFQYPDVSGATNAEIKNCNAQSGGKYTISYQILPASSDSQRLQLVRRLAAHDPSIDIMALDVTWEAEFANAGWIVPWTGADKQQVVNGTIKPALQTAMWKGKLVAAPDNTNTQLLWYRSDLVPTPPKTWAEMLADAAKLKAEGKPHYIEIQGAQYEGTTVWFNTMVTSAGGTILNPSATKVTLGAPAVKALSMMKQLATSAGADPSLAVQMENENRLAMEAGNAAFQLNYPFVYPAMKAGQPEAVQVLQVGALPGGHPRRTGQGDDRRHGPRGQLATPSTRRSPSRPRSACGTSRTSSSAPPSAASRRRSPASTPTRRCSRTTRSTPTSCTRCSTRASGRRRRSTRSYPSTSRT